MVERFAAIRGQDKALSLLSRYLDAGSVPQGLLFSGEEGIGKETAARAFVAALFCRARTAAGACGDCAECRLLSAGGHPNLLRVSPENHFIKIDEVRALQEELALKAFSDRPRVAILVPAERMTLQAANALLKTLEEPPAGTHLLLVAHRLSALPPTIASRCQKVPFSPLTTADTVAVLREVPGIRDAHPDGKIRGAAACSGGSPGRAITLLSEAGADRDGWAALFGTFDPAAIVREAATWKGTEEPWGRLAVPLSLARDIALLSSGGKAGIMNDDLRDALGRIARRKTGSGWTRDLGSLLAMPRMPPQAQKRLLMEAFLFALHA